MFLTVEPQGTIIISQSRCGVFQSEAEPEPRWNTNQAANLSQLLIRILENKKSRHLLDWSADRCVQAFDSIDLS